MTFPDDRLELIGRWAALRRRCARGLRKLARNKSAAFARRHWQAFYWRAEACQLLARSLEDSVVTASGKPQVAEKADFCGLIHGTCGLAGPGLLHASHAIL